MTKEVFQHNFEAVSAARKSNGKPDNRAIILGIYLLVGSACIIWLAVFLFHVRPRDETAPAPTARPGRESSDMPEPQEPEKRIRGKLALIIDDAGYNNAFLETFLAFPGPMAVSVLPGLPGSRDASRLVRKAGKELLLHLPMEPENGQDPGPGAVYTRMGDEAVRDLVRGHLDSLPGIVGVNNHMGSRATADERVMSLVLGVLRERGLFFVDSGTTAASAGRRVAGELKLPFLERSVFLDNEKDKAAIRESIERGKAVAEKRGYAVMIGHVWCSELAEVLLEVYPDILDEGYRFYPVSELLKGESSGEDSWN